MAFSQVNFNPIGGQSLRGRAPQRWSYATLDTAATVDTSGYFNAVANLVEVGDMIDRVTWTTAIGSKNGGTLSTVGTHIVIVNAAGVVDVADANVLAITNTD